MEKEFELIEEIKIEEIELPIETEEELSNGLEDGEESEDNE